MTIILPEAAEGRKRQRRMRPVRVSRKERRQYINALNAQADLLRAATANLSDLVRSGADRAAVAGRLRELARITQGQIDRLAPRVAGQFVDATDQANKESMQASLRQALGVDFAAILDEPGLRARLDMAIDANARLIGSIGQEHWAKVGQAVLDNYSGKELPGGASLLGRLQELGGITKRRATVIARDQTSKLTGALNQERQQANGIKRYIWRTSKDQRVVGNPAGLYPEGTRAHGDHWDREGQVYEWAKPPADGHPGEAILCRCYAEPILDLEELDARYV